MLVQLFRLVWIFVTPTDSNSPDSFTNGIPQARILEWVAISYSRGSSQTRDWTCISSVFYIGRGILYHWVAWEALNIVLAVGFFLNSFYWVEEITSYSYIVRYFYHISYHVSYIISYHIIEFWFRQMSFHVFFLLFFFNHSFY